MEVDEPQRGIGRRCAGDKRLYIALVIAALLSGLMGWEIVRVFETGPVSDAVFSVLIPRNRSLSPTFQLLDRHFRLKHTERVATASFTLIGGSACLFAAAVMISQQREHRIANRWSSGFAALILGMFCGLIAGRLAVLLNRIYDHFPILRAASGNAFHLRVELLGIVLHTAEWLVISVGIGLAAGLAFRGRVNVWRPACGAAAGGTAAAAFYPLFAGLMFPIERAEWLIPQGSLNQLMWLLFTMLMIAAGMCRVLSRTDVRW